MELEFHFFEFWQSQGSNNWNYTSLMGEDKMKVLKNFDIESVLPKDRSDLIHELWNDFDMH